MTELSPPAVDEVLTGERRPLRVGVVLEGRGIARYALDIVRQIRAIPSTKIEVVLRDARDRRHGGWAFRAYARLDQRIVGVTDDPLAILDGSADLAGLPEIPLANLTGGQVDLLIDLREQGRPDSTRVAPALGWWWLDHGGRTPAGFWEIVRWEPLTTIELRVSRADGVRALGYAATSTVTGLSWARNRLAPYREAVTLVVEKLRQVHNGGFARAVAPALHTLPTPTVPGPGKGPTSLEVGLWLISAGTRKIFKKLARRKTVPMWQMAIRDTSRPLVELGRGDNLEGFRWLRAPAGRQYADPFLLNHEDRIWCFFEDIDTATGLGRISAAEVASGELRAAVTVLERPYHLSYPCVFRDGDALLMIPECSENGAIELYRCVAFPSEWALERILLRRTAVDSTICFRDGRYWLFATHLDERSHATELWLYSSESLTGAWVSHPQNPISLDVRNARGAGAIVEHDGRWFRPSQDCSIRYGRSFWLNEILTLTPEQYEERAVVTIDPMPGFVCTHTYARSGRIEMIDGCAQLK